MAQAVEYQPLVLVEAADLSREEWLAYRRQGLGGSDAASVLGISPFRTAVDLYCDKRNLPIEDDEGNWVAMEAGTLLEDLAARIFAKKTGLKIYRRKCMFQHPLDAGRSGFSCGNAGWQHSNSGVQDHQLQRPR